MIGHAMTHALAKKNTPPSRERNYLFSEPIIFSSGCHKSLSTNVGVVFVRRIHLTFVIQHLLQGLVALHHSLVILALTFEARCTFFDVMENLAKENQIY